MSISFSSARFISLNRRHVSFLHLSLLLSVILFTGTSCYRGNERLDILEEKLENQQVYDMRISNLEERVTSLESDIGVINSGLAPKKTLPKKISPKNKKQAEIPVMGVPVNFFDHSSHHILLGGKEGALARNALDNTVATIQKSQKSNANMALSSKPDTSLNSSKHSQSARKPRINSEEQARYDHALKLYDHKNYIEAEEQFSEFLVAFPSSKLAPNAMYWNAECYYSKNDFVTAIVRFKNVAAMYPKHPKAAAALFKLGLCYKKMDDLENSNFYWSILKDDFPQSEPARLIDKQ